MVRVKKRISIVLVDDYPPTGEGIVGRIGAARGFSVRTVPAKLQLVARTVRETRPDLVLLHLAQRGRYRLAFAGALHGAIPDLPVIIMGLAASREHNIEGLVRAGVAGFIMANAPLDAFMSTILLVARGIRVLPADLTHGLFNQLRRRNFRPSVQQARS